MTDGLIAGTGNGVYEAFWHMVGVGWTFGINCEMFECRMIATVVSIISLTSLH